MKTKAFAIGDRIRWRDKEPFENGWYYGRIGKVIRGRHRRAFERGWVWVNWDDGVSGFVDPNTLDAA